MTKHCSCGKKREPFEFSGTSRSSSVCKFNESVEVTVTSPLSSHVSFCICLACVTFSIRFALLSLDLKDTPISISTSRSSITVISLGTPALIFAIFSCFSFSFCLALFNSAAISAGNLSEMTLWSSSVITNRLLSASPFRTRIHSLLLHLKLTIHNASEAISAEFLRLRKTRALHSGLK